MDFLHTIINYFANGKSDMKVYMFFVFCGLLLCVNIFFKSNKFNLEKTKRFIIVLMIILYSLNVGSFIYFFKSNNIPLLSNIYVFNNNEVSSSNILHNHTLKSPIGFLLEKIGINPVQDYVDTGYAYTTFFSSIFLYIVLILMFLLIMSFAFYVKSSKLSRLQTFIFSIVSFSVLKNIFDGGLFHIESVLSISLLLIIFKNNQTYDRKYQQQNLLIFLIYLSIAIVLAFTSDEFIPLHGNYFMIEFIKKFFFFFALAIIYYKKQIKQSLIVISLIPIVLIISTIYLLQTIYSYQESQTVIYPSQHVFGYIPKPIPDSFITESYIDFKNTSLLKGYSKDKITKKDLIKKLKVDNSFYTLKINDTDCDISYKEVRNFDIRLDNKNIDMSNDLFKIKKDSDSLSITESLSCLTINQSILKGIFNDYGISKVILIQHE